METDLAAVAELATGETVLITGAGGSIGSELCRQLARLAPTRLILPGHGENSIFDILHELRLAFPDIAFIPVIANDLIRLSGLSIGSDIEIKVTGMRPGEKLYEEMFFSAENVIPTNHPKVLRARNGILPEGVPRRVDSLIRAAEQERPDDGLRQLLKTLAPDFHRHGMPTVEEPVKTEAVRHA
ncbi:MAG: polysaccharide biosynthesis protein [Gemmatimonadaceae bacterium]|nr:polysaccharide biosynthesis protein [Gemmatimonadaceae bacterium]